MLQKIKRKNIKICVDITELVCYYIGVTKRTNKTNKKKREQNMKNMDNKFIFTEEQQEVVCKHFGKKREELEFWEICELLDRVIDNLAI